MISVCYDNHIIKYKGGNNMFKLNNVKSYLDENEVSYSDTKLGISFRLNNLYVSIAVPAVYDIEGNRLSECFVTVFECNPDHSMDIVDKKSFESEVALIEFISYL